MFIMEWFVVFINRKQRKYLPKWEMVKQIIAHP